MTYLLGSFIAGAAFVVLSFLFVVIYNSIEFLMTNRLPNDPSKVGGEPTEHDKPVNNKP